MKNLYAAIIFFCGAHLAFAESAAEKAQKADAYYRKGLAAENAGQPEVAFAAYQAATQLNAGHTDARFRMGEVKRNASKIKANAAEAKIGAIVIPVYQIEDLPLQEALEVLAAAIEKNSKEKTITNFVVDDPTKKLKDSKISLNIKNVPASAILKYIQDQTGTKIRYDEYAIVVAAR